MLTYYFITFKVVISSLPQNWKRYQKIYNAVCICINALNTTNAKFSDAIMLVVSTGMKRIRNLGGFDKLDNCQTFVPCVSYLMVCLILIFNLPLCQK